MNYFSLNFLFVRLPIVGVFILLSACASTGGGNMQGQSMTAVPQQVGAHFPEWSVLAIGVGNRAQQGEVPPAVVKLTAKADAEIAHSEWNEASVTLERLLRIMPDYAPGWSRLSWLALQTKRPDRAREMAQRSNSYATGHIDLKILNWQFFRQASVMLNDQNGIDRADRNISALRNL